MSAAVRFNDRNLEDRGVKSILGVGAGCSDVTLQGLTIIGFRRFRARRRVWPLLRWILRRHEVVR